MPDHVTATIRQFTIRRAAARGQRSGKMHVDWIGWAELIGWADLLQLLNGWSEIADLKGTGKKRKT